MGWQDDPVIGRAPAVWGESDPIVGQAAGRSWGENDPVIGADPVPYGVRAAAQRSGFGDVLARQFGLGVRMVGEGAADLAGIVGNPANVLLNKTFGTELPTDLGAAAGRLMTRAGLPQPETGAERIANVGGRALSSGAAGLAAGGASVIPAAARAFLTAAPVTQLAAPAAGAMTGQGLVEAGVDPLLAAGAGLGTALVGGVAMANRELGPAGVQFADEMRRMRGGLPPLFERFQSGRNRPLSDADVGIVPLPAQDAPVVAPIVPDVPTPQPAAPRAVAPELPAPAAPPDVAPPPPGAANVQRVAVADLGIDAPTYQFRSNVNAAGVDDRLGAVKKWDDLRAGLVIVHERADGSRWIADGHHRLDMAKRLEQPTVNAIVLREADGFGVDDVRRVAAQTNIAQGSGTPVDAAKLFRNSGKTIEETLADANLPNNALAKQGAGLAQLSEDNFAAVVNRVVSERDGAIIGRTFATPDEQTAALKVFARVQPANSEEAELLASQIKAAGFNRAAPEQGGLFGAAIDTDSLLGERNKVLATLSRELGKDRTIFGALERNAGRIEGAGNVLARGTNRTIADEAAGLREWVTRTAFTDPAIKGRLDAAALAYRNDPRKLASVVADLKDDLRATLNRPEATNGNVTGADQPSSGGLFGSEPQPRPGTGAGTVSAFGAGQVGPVAQRLAADWQRYAGQPAWQFLKANPGSAVSSAIGFSGGVASADEDAPALEKIGRGLTGAALGWGTAKGLGRIPTKDGNVAEVASKWFIDNYGLRPEYVAVKKAMGAYQNSIADQFLTIAREANKLPKEQRSLLYNILQGEAPRTADLARLTDTARSTITELGQRMVDYGMLNPETFAKNAATYLHRSYTSKQPGTQPGFGSRAIKMIGSELKPRGVLKEVSLNEVEKFKVAGWEEFGKPKPGAESRTMRWQLTKQQRQQLGEVEDAAYAIAETGRLMSRDIATFKFFDDIGARFASDFAEPGLVQVSTDKIPKTGLAKFGNLAGKYLPEDIYNDLTRMVGMRDFMNLPGVREYRTLNAWWKTTKTALNPVVHTNNVLSNIVLYDLADAGWSHVARAGKELALAKSGRTAPMYEMAKRAGVFDANLANQELAKASREMLEQYAQIRTEPMDPLRTAIEIAKKGWSKTGGRMVDLYSAEDSVFRLAVFSDRLRKGMNTEQAAAEARRWFVDYEINAPAIEVLRNTATPFLAYTYRVTPLLAETATLRPWKFAKWAALGYGINKAGEELGGGDTARERALLPERQRGNLWGLPGMPPQAIKMPFQVGGTPQYLDATRWTPGGDVLDVSQDNPAIPFLPAPAQPSFGAVGSLMSAAYGFDPFRRKELPGLGYSLAEDAKIKGGYLAQQFLPNFPGVPGAYSTQKIMDSMRGVQTPLGDQLPPWQAILQSVGVKLNPADLQKMQARTAFEMKRDLEAAAEQMKGYMRDAALQRVTPEQLADRQQEFRTTAEKIIAKYTKRLNTPAAAAPAPSRAMQ